MKASSVGILSTDTGKTRFTTKPSIGEIEYVTWQITRGKEPVFDENDQFTRFNLADKRRISGTIAFSTRNLNVGTFDLMIEHEDKENNYTTTTISDVALVSDGAICRFTAKDITHTTESNDKPVTCKRCEDITDETISEWRKQKRIAELKAELLELEGPKQYHGYIINTNTIAENKDKCGVWLGKWPYCCPTHCNDYMNTAG